jgi:uncharacterized membrane protein YphA (DoxX/SURF4 family)
MATHLETRPRRSIPSLEWHGVDVGAPTVRNPAFDAFWLLRIGFGVAPILFGLDKFFNYTVDWTIYLAPWVNDIAPGTAQQFMYFVGVTEIAAGLLVAVAPRIGALVVAGWLAGIVLNLLTVDPPTYYDIALRDFGLLLGALTLARLAWGLGRAPVSEPSEATSVQRRAGAPTESPLPH